MHNLELSEQEIIRRQSLEELRIWDRALSCRIIRSKCLFNRYKKRI